MAAPQMNFANAMKSQNALFARIGATYGGFVLGNPGLTIDTNFDVKAANAFDVVINGKIYTIAADTSFDTGTSEIISTANYWVAGLLSVDNDATAYCQFGSDMSTEAAAIDQLDGITPTGECVVGYVTIKTKADTADFVAGTDALQGGTGGDVSADTNYYNVWGWVK